MKKMYIYEPAMCCPTGLCGVGVDKELLRISSVLSNLEKNGVKVERFNLTNSPQEFVKNKEINQLMEEKGIKILPVTTVDNVVVKTGSYPTNEEMTKFLDVSPSFLEDVASNAKASGGCCSGGGCC
jgi:hypothetical protein